MEPLIQAEARRIFLVLREVLRNRGLAQKLKSGNVREIAWKTTVYLPHARTLMYVADVGRLPVPLEKIVTDEVAHEVCTALQGRPVRIINERGLAFLIGIDVPALIQKRRLSKSIDLDLSTRPDGPYMVPLGEGSTGPVWRPLAELDAVLVGGTRRLGKSMLLNTWLAALMTAHPVEELRVVLVDPKEVELATWKDAPHLLGPVATDAAEASKLLSQVLGELETRKALVTNAGAVNLAEYNALVPPEKRLPAILVVVDELSDLAFEAGGPKSMPLQILGRLVMKGGAFGLHPVLSLQRPDADALAGFLKANLATRISFYFAGAADYRVTLNPTAGTPLPQIPRIPGRMIARMDDGYSVLQGYYLSREARAEIAAQVAGGEVVGAGAGVLSEDQEEMVRWAVADNDGYLSIADIQDQTGLSYHKARKIGEEWEQCHWLVKDPDNQNKRRVTVELAKLVEEFAVVPEPESQTPQGF